MSFKSGYISTFFIFVTEFNFALKKHFELTLIGVVHQDTGEY